MQASFGQTIFAWTANYESSDLLATSLADFRNTSPLGLWNPSNLSPFAMTKFGLSISLNMMESEEEEDGSRKARSMAALQCDAKVGDFWEILMFI